jgi:hypothetical protein
MSYQRWTQGDAYVIGADGLYRRPMFLCVGCDYGTWFETYRAIVDHLKVQHHNSQLAIDRLTAEAERVGYDKSWDAFLALEEHACLP